MNSLLMSGPIISETKLFNDSISYFIQHTGERGIIESFLRDLDSARDSDNCSFDPPFISELFIIYFSFFLRDLDSERDSDDCSSGPPSYLKRCRLIGLFN